VKIAILSDIHGNKDALQQVCNQLRKENIGKVLILGDIVGYYYYPAEVLQMLREFDFEFIKGNHEIILEALCDGEIDKDQVRLKYGSGHVMALNSLSQSDLHFLFEAPITRKVVADNTTILMCHGAPWSVDEYLYPDTLRKTLERCTDGTVEFVVVGHSHYQFAFAANGTTLINVGSVGQSRLCGGLANWAVIDSTSQTFQLRSTKYDVAPLLKEVETIDGDVPYLKEILVRNNSKNV
jgi:predicted phosphodiesterase